VPPGLSVQEVVALMSIVVGCILLFCSLALLWKERKDVAGNQSPVELEIPAVKMKAPSTAAFLAIFGAMMVGYPGYKLLETPEMLPVSGKIQMYQNRAPGPFSNIVVSVIPSSYVTNTIADGSYVLNIPKAGKGVAYQALLQVPNTKPPIFHLGVVQFSPEGHGKFDHTFNLGNK
jgi:hypothetical protein